MGILDYFKKVPSMTAKEVGAFTGKRGIGEYVLLDVRQLKEYTKGHIAGALLIPIGDLPQRIEELDRQKPVIVYCAIGGRSRAAAAMLLEAGFAEVFNVSGGFKSWKGAGVQGPPESGMAYFGDIEDPLEVLVLAWAMEEGTRQFYEAMENSERDEAAKKIFKELAVVEVSHQGMLEDLRLELPDKKAEKSGSLQKVFHDSGLQELLVEGQLKLAEALDWAKSKDTVEVLQYAMALEASLLDLYFKLQLRFKSGGTHLVFFKLAQQEKQHLESFSVLMEKSLPE